MVSEKGEFMNLGCMEPSGRANWMPFKRPGMRLT